MLFHHVWSPKACPLRRHLRGSTKMRPAIGVHLVSPKCSPTMFIPQDFSSNRFHQACPLIGVHQRGFPHWVPPKASSPSVTHKAGPQCDSPKGVPQGCSPVGVPAILVPHGSDNVGSPSCSPKLLREAGPPIRLPRSWSPKRGPPRAVPQSVPTVVPLEFPPRSSLRSWPQGVLTWAFTEGVSLDGVNHCVVQGGLQGVPPRGHICGLSHRCPPELSPMEFSQGISQISSPIVSPDGFLQWEYQGVPTGVFHVFQKHGFLNGGLQRAPAIRVS
jgi:hypothetical protein